MNELPTKRVVFDRFDPMAAIVQAAAMSGERFEWEGEQWQVYALWHDTATGETVADLVLAPTVEFVSPPGFQLDDPVDQIVHLQPSKASDLDPPAWCSCGKPAVRGGLCATEPAAPMIDYRDLLIRYIALVRSKAWEEHPAFPGGTVMNRPHFTDEERTALADIGDESRERYPL